MTKILSSRVIFFLAVVPFMIICPLTMSVVFTGFPFEQWNNNAALKDYVTISRVMDLDEYTPIGNDFGILGRFSKGFPGDQYCDLVYVKIFKADAEQDEVSRNVLARFQEAFATLPSDNPASKLFNGSNVKLFPIADTEADRFDNGEISFSFKEDANIESIELFEEEVAYVLYLMKDRAFETRDYRCVAK